MRLPLILCFCFGVFACASSSTGPSDASSTGVDAASCGDAATPSCFHVVGGYCDDVGGPEAVCSAGAWSCPAGSVAREQCHCGVPPIVGCDRDGGTVDGSNGDGSVTPADASGG